MHPPQWTHYQLALCFQHTLHRPLRAHTPLHKHMCAHTHTRRITNWNPNYGRMWMYTHAGINTHTHMHTRTDSDWNENVTPASKHMERINPKCVHVHALRHHTHTHTDMLQSPCWLLLTWTKGKKGYDQTKEDYKVWSKTVKERWREGGREGEGVVYLLGAICTRDARPCEGKRFYTLSGEINPISQRKHTYLNAQTPTKHTDACMHDECTWMSSYI